MITMITALSEPTRAIGKDNKLLWHLPPDMQHFKRITEHHAVIMGRKTWDSIPEHYRPLSNRENIIISSNAERHNKTEQNQHVYWVSSLEGAIDKAQNLAAYPMICIIGGASVYQEALSKNLVDTMYITYVEKHFDGDTFFPEFDKEQWEETFLGQDVYANIKCRFMYYRRK